MVDERLDDGSDRGEMLFVDGQVRDTGGKPIAGAVVDVWHANPLGGYSFFDPSQPKYNLRRRIETDVDGRYRFRSILPAGYACPPGGPTQSLLDQLGRHGRRPAHIHFFVTAPGYRKLTTQINIDGETSFNGAEDAFAKEDYDTAISNYQSVLGSSSSKPWMMAIAATIGSHRPIGRPTRSRSPAICPARSAASWSNARTSSEAMAVRKALTPRIIGSADSTGPIGYRRGRYGLPLIP